MADGSSREGRGAMKVFLTGATGFIGTTPVRALAERGDECVVLSPGERNPWPEPRARRVQGARPTGDRWKKEVDGMDGFITLAGGRIEDPPHRWSDERKRR